MEEPITKLTADCLAGDDAEGAAAADAAAAKLGPDVKLVKIRSPLRTLDGALLLRSFAF